MTTAAVIDSSTAIALVRGGVFDYLGSVFQPLFIGHGAERECRKVPSVDVAFSRTQSGSPPFPIVVTLVTRSRIYDPKLSREDIEGIEIALDKSVLLLTQDDIQTIEAKNTRVYGVLHTFHLLEGFKRSGRITQVRPVLEQMEQNGEYHPKAEKNRLLRQLNEPLIP
jgi:predicted nucleic acid-binding protein